MSSSQRGTERMRKRSCGPGSCGSGCPQRKFIHYHLVVVVDRATSQETPGEVDIRFRPPGGRKRVHIHLPRGLPEGSPADHPNEVVVDIFPLGRMSSWRSTTMALAYEWASNVLHNFRKRSLLLPSPSLFFLICFAGFRPNLAPRLVPTGRARQMMQNAPQISPGDQF